VAAVTYAHGTYAKYKLDNCRCYPCCGAGSEYRMNRSRAIAYGTWQPFVDAEPVRRHVQNLRECGLGLRRIAELAPVDMCALRRLMNGMKGRPPAQRLRPGIAQAILTVEPTLDNLASKTPIDAAGSHRRLQALVCVGWSQSKLADRLGMAIRNFCTLIRAERVTAGKAKQIRALYDELWDQAPPESAGPDRAAASRARNYAKARGWLPPMAWDDDLIDLPATELKTELARRVQLMDDDEVRRYRNARYNLRDQSPVIVAGAREGDRRVRLKRAS
jgi:transcriptional regulator with XRE-family HTH domain